MQKSQTEKKRAVRWNYPRLIACFLLAVLAVPALFTLVQMGAFSSDPVVETEATAGPEAPVLRVATDYDFCPNSYYNEDGELCGLYIEIITEAANRMGMRPEFETSTWLQCRQMLTEGEADVLLGLEIFSNMEGTLRTIPICSDELRVYGKDTIDSAAALAGKRVALMARSVIAATYDLQCQYVEYYTNQEILQAVENGEADYAIFHSAVASKLIERYHWDLQPSLVITKSYPALAVKDTRPELKEELNTVLQEMSVDGTIGKLQEKWITDFTKNKSLNYVLHTNQLFYITFFFGALVVLCVIVIFMLLNKKQEEYITSLLAYQKQLKASEDEAVRANRAKSIFLSHMSHDIRTPMNGILGMAAQIRRSKDDPAAIDGCLDKIDVASGHLLSLLNDVLDMSAIESSEVVLEQRPFDLLAALEEVRTIEASEAAREQLTLAIHTEGVSHRHLMSSPLHLRRILLNLVSNALKYNRPSGRVDVTAEELACDGKRADFRFTVQDTGIGMSREFVQKHLFQPFSQENDNVRTEYQGTGLGMSIVDKLVKALGGSIQVESEQGVGTTFTVFLSFSLDEHEPTAAVDTEPDRDISGMHILVAEDNDLNREIAQAILEEAGATVTTAANGQEAVDRFTASRPGEFDAILMDLMMPVLDGLQAARAIRRSDHPDAKDICILAMTANALAEDKQAVLDAGMNAHLTKPIQPEILYALLARARRVLK